MDQWLTVNSWKITVGVATMNLGALKAGMTFYVFMATEDKQHVDTAALVANLTEIAGFM